MTDTSRTSTGKIALASTLHDPDQRFLPYIRSVGHYLNWYDHVAIAATETTATDVHVALEALGAVVVRVGLGMPGESRRVALRNAAVDRSRSVLSCDFDRWLHWAHSYPDELATLPHRVGLTYPAAWYLCLGRTRRAFRSHPRVQQEAEAATNHVLELVVGEPIDAVAGASWVSPEGAELILSRSIEPTSATDLEWPAVVYHADPARLGFLANEGLEFETATFYPDEIDAAGERGAWIDMRYERPQVWAERLRLAADSVAALTRVLRD